jgi:hypothetical protein
VAPDDHPAGVHVIGLVLSLVCSLAGLALAVRSLRGIRSLEGQLAYARGMAEGHRRRANRFHRRAQQAESRERLGLEREARLRRTIGATCAPGARLQGLRLPEGVSAIESTIQGWMPESAAEGALFFGVDRSMPGGKA